jgi:muramoyltetrapeptide carboxypeptidase LdcA involved in peptidoglycan recycling
MVKMRGRSTTTSLHVELAPHVFDRWGYLAGRDDDRLDDINEAIRDPEVPPSPTSRPRS